MSNIFNKRAVKMLRILRCGNPPVKMLATLKKNDLTN